MTVFQSVRIAISQMSDSELTTVQFTTFTVGSQMYARFFAVDQHGNRDEVAVIAVESERAASQTLMRIGMLMAEGIATDTPSDPAPAGPQGSGSHVFIGWGTCWGITAYTVADWFHKHKLTLPPTQGADRQTPCEFSLTVRPDRLENEISLVAGSERRSLSWIVDVHNIICYTRCVVRAHPIPSHTFCPTSEDRCP